MPQTSSVIRYRKYQFCYQWFHLCWAGEPDSVESFLDFFRIIHDGAETKNEEISMTAFMKRQRH
jgi:hypothetical protein